MAFIALIFANLISWGDRKAKILCVMPSVFKSVHSLLLYITLKLDRRERSAAIRSKRAYVVLLFTLSAGLGFGSLTQSFFYEYHYSYLEIIILTGFFLTLTDNIADVATKDTSIAIRNTIEFDAVRLLERNAINLFGWMVAGWMGMMLCSFLTILVKVVSGQSNDFSTPIIRFANLLFMPASFFSVTMLSLAAIFTSRGKPLPSLRNGLSYITTPYHAQIEVVATAISITLIGPKSAFASLFKNIWIGQGIVRVQSADKKRWYQLKFITQLLIISFVGVLSILPF